MTPDFEPLPPPAATIQLEALRAAFPGYSISLIVPAPGQKPRYEAVCRGSDDLYCVISEDAREIWQELKR